MVTFYCIYITLYAGLKKKSARHPARFARMDIFSVKVPAQHQVQRQKRKLQVTVRVNISKLQNNRGTFQINTMFFQNLMVESYLAAATQIVRKPNSFLMFQRLGSWQMLITL